MARYLLTFKSARPFQPAFAYLRYFSTTPLDLKHNADSSANSNEDSSLYSERRNWNEQDTNKLIKLVEEHGNKWTLFAKSFPGRCAESVRRRYRHVKDNYQWLTLEEKTIIQDLLGREQSFENIDWQQVQQSLPYRKPISTIQKYYRSIHPSVNKGTWTEKETRELFVLVGKHGKDWSLISRQMGTRSEDQCSQKYTYEMNTQNAKMGRFSKEEDEALLDAVNKYGTESFNKIKKEANSERSIIQLRYRYYNFLDPEIDRSPWTMEEKEQVFSLYTELKSAKLVKEKLNSKRSYKRYD